jgi:hypothetical protein
MLTRPDPKLLTVTLFPMPPFASAYPDPPAVKVAYP